MFAFVVQVDVGEGGDAFLVLELVVALEVDAEAVFRPSDLRVKLRGGGVGGGLGREEARGECRVSLCVIHVCATRSTNSVPNLTSLVI